MWPKKLKEMPRVKAVMTPFPYSIERAETLERARKMMRTHRIHHLPVLQDGVPVGILSHRELQLSMNRSGDDPDSSPTVADVRTEKVYVVDLSEPLDRVLLHMAREHVGAALVVKEERLAGIFTLTDACQCLAESLRDQFPPVGGDEAA